jgi:N-acetylglucosamine transport system permease protein
MTRHEATRSPKLTIGVIALLVIGVVCAFALPIVTSSRGDVSLRELWDAPPGYGSARWVLAIAGAGVVVAVVAAVAFPLRHCVPQALVISLAWLATTVLPIWVELNLGRGQSLGAGLLASATAFVLAAAIPWFALGSGQIGRMHEQKYGLIVTFLAPAILLYLVFVLFPYGQSFYYSLTQWRGVSGNRTFIWFDNFKKLPNDEIFVKALTHNGQMLIVLPLATITLALLFATLFTQGGRGVRGAQAYRVVFFFPQVMSVVIIGILWQYIYNPISGLLNGTLRAIGLDSLQRSWLGSEDLALWAIAVVFVWQVVGFYMVLFIAGMQSIPTSFYEAATLDGANRWRSFWGITLPLMWDTIRVAIVYIGIAALDLFTIVQVMTEGKPNRSTEVVARYMYEVGFGTSLFGYASAIGVALLAMTLALSIVTLRLTQREQLEF